MSNQSKASSQPHPQSLCKGGSWMRPRCLGPAPAGCTCHGTLDASQTKATLEFVFGEFCSKRMWISHRLASVTAAGWPTAWSSPSGSQWVLWVLQTRPRSRELPSWRGPPTPGIAGLSDARRPPDDSRRVCAGHHFAIGRQPDNKAQPALLRRKRLAASRPSYLSRRTEDRVRRRRQRNRVYRSAF